MIVASDKAGTQTQPETPEPVRSKVIVFDDVSKFYGDVLGINRVSLTIAPGVTSLVGPNGSGKTTMMNLMTGLIRPTRGTVSVLGTSPEFPEEFGRLIGYCSQFDSFQKGITGRAYVENNLLLHGYQSRQAAELAAEALERVNMQHAAALKAGSYSKGMRQRLRLAQAIAHKPSVLVLDEPLNGLDPMGRAESLALFKELGQEGLHVIISSHILHEVDQVSDRVVLLSYGYVVAEGKIHGVRAEVEEQPMQILLRCEDPSRAVALLFESRVIVEAKMVEAEGLNGPGALVRTRDAESFYSALNQIVLSHSIALESVAPADDDVLSVYQYLIGSDGTSQ